MEKAGLQMASLIWEPMNVMNKLHFYVCLFSMSIYLQGYCQGQDENRLRGNIRIMFYNTENYFDTYNDSLTLDDEYLPKSDKHWTNARYQEKTNNLFKVIAASGQLHPPEIIAFAEIENKKVLSDLLNKTPLEKYNYKIVHFNSPDLRGIDVGLLYAADKVTKLGATPIRIVFPFSKQKKSRDILYFKSLIGKTDTLHLFVNHWPSRVGGISKSEVARTYVAGILKAKTDSILAANPFALIVITGDFNDEPKDISLTGVLAAKMPTENIACRSLYNLSLQLQESCKCGTYRFKSKWNMLDQFIVSGQLLKTNSKIKTCADCAKIANFDFLMVQDEKYGGMKPYRSYTGPAYKGGYSDHLPIYLDLFYTEKTQVSKKK